MARQINLALQGGGAHGAFTWGVLDRLLDEEDVEVAAISGTSAGALNGAAFKAGMAQDGREGARAQLGRLWQRMGAVGDLRFAHWMAGFDAPAMLRLFEAAVPYSPLEAVSQVVSPYHYGPFYKNPLRPVVERFEYGSVCAEAGPRLHVCATNVRTGKVRVFSGEEIGPEAILASACLPNLFQAVEIADPASGRVEAYWDGGFTGNPALFPLMQEDLPPDVVIVNINPLVRDAVPKTPQQIQNRVNEISFNSSLLRELRAVSFVQRLLEDGRLARGSMKQVFTHMIADDALMNELSVTSKLVPVPQILGLLKTAGQRAADRFLADSKADLGRRATVDLADMFD